MKRLMKNVFLLMLVGFIGFSPHLAKSVVAKSTKNSTSAQMKAFNFGDCKSNGSFQKYLNSSKDENGFKISNFATKFNFSSKKLVCKDSNGKKITIDLSERCGDANGAPHRYYFWLKSNKLKSPNSIYWRTEYFMGTQLRIKEGKGVDSYGKPIEKGTYNAKETINNVRAIRVDRLEAVAKSGTFFSSVGKALSANGAKYENCLYVIDIKDWYKENSKNNNGYTGNIYLQSITKIYNPNGTKRTENMSTLAAWWDAATKNSFAASGKQTYYQHYNQWIKLDRKVPHTTIFHRIQADAKEPIYGNKKNPVVGTIDTHGKRKETTYTNKNQIKANSGFSMNNIKTYTDASGEKWYLKGVQITNQKYEGAKEEDCYSFYILDSVNSTKSPQITGTSNATTNYSKKNGSGKKKNTVAGQKNVCAHGTVVVSDNKKQFHLNSSVMEPIGGVGVYSGEYVKDKHSWSYLADYMGQIMFKATNDITHVYLVYAKNSPSLTFNATYWTVKDGKYQCSDSSKVTNLGTVDRDKLKKALGGKWYGTLSKSKFSKFINSSWGTQKNSVSGSDDYAYTLKKYRVHYYSSKVGKDGKQKETTTEWMDLTDSVWDGKNGGADAVGKEALKKLKEASIADADFSKGVTVDLGYYQPLAPSKMKVYLKKFNDSSGSVSMSEVECSAVPNVSTGGEKVYDRLSGSVSCIRPTAGAGYSTPGAPSFSVPGGYHVTKGVSLTKQYVVEGDVGGYLGAKSDCVTLENTHVSESANAGGLKFNAGYSGRIAVAVYEVHYEQDPPSNPPPGWTPPKYGHYEVRYHLATAIGGKIPDKSSSEWIDAGFRESSVYTTHGAKVKVDIPGSVNGGNIYPAYNTSSSTSHCPSGFNGSVTITWGSYDTTSVRLDVYYVIKKNITHGSPESSEKKEIFTWDDTDGNGEKSSLGSPSKTVPDGNPVLQGVIEGDNVPELYEVVSDPTIGSDGEIMLPNGTNTNGTYKPNTLKNRANCTSYLTRGQVTKHTNTWKIPVTFVKSYGLKGANTSIVTKEDTITVNVVWFSLEKLEILKPDGAIIYNYAYSEGAADTRTPNKNLHTILTFNGGEWDWGQAENGKAHCTAKDIDDIVFNLKAEARSSAPSESDIKKECSEYLAKHMKEFITGHFDVGSDILVFNTPSWQSNEDDNSSDKGGYDVDLSHLDKEVEVVEDGLDLPDEEIKTEEPDGVESDNVIFKEDTYAFEVSSALFSSGSGMTSEIDLTDDADDAKSEYSAKLTFKNLSSFRLEDLRILAPSLSCRNDLFSNSGIEIQKKKLNTGSDGAEPAADSSLVISYTPVRAIGYGKADRYYKTDNINKVVLHTPISIKVSVKKAEDHLIQNTTEHPGYGRVVPLGTPFTLGLDYVGDFTGVYGTVDTEKYTLEDGTAYMRFEYESWVKHPDGSVDYHPKDETYKLKDVEKCVFYAAYWAEEGNLPIHVTVECLNTYENGTSGGVLPKGDCIAGAANVSRDYYCAMNEVFTDLNGRLFGLRQYDVADYPTLQNVFRQGDSYKKSGKTIVSGNKNFLGIDVDKDGLFPDSAAVFPIVDGDSIDGVSYGAYKTGYVVRYNITTIASLTNQSDNLIIEPAFYWVKNGIGEQEKRAVKLYYNENVNGKNSTLVEVGGKADRENWHQFCIGDLASDVNLGCLVDTSKAQKYEEPKDLIQKVEDAWTYSGVRLPASASVCEGDLYRDVLKIASDGTELGIPGSVSWEQVNRCLQTWYGEYYLPDDLHVRLADADADRQFAEDGKTGYDFKEEYWCNDGYLVVNFDIRTIKAGEEHLSYDGTVLDPNHLDMWKMEESCKSKMGDWFQKFVFNEGDFIVYDLKTSMSRDYRSGGTH